MVGLVRGRFGLGCVSSRLMKLLKMPFSHIRWIHCAVVLVQEIVSLFVQISIWSNDSEESSKSTDPDQFLKFLQELINVFGSSLSHLNLTSNLRNFVVFENWFGYFVSFSSLVDSKGSRNYFDQSKEKESTLRHLENLVVAIWIVISDLRCLVNA